MDNTAVIEKVGHLTEAVKELKTTFGEESGRRSELKERYDKLNEAVEAIQADIKEMGTRQTAIVEGNAVGAAAKIAAKGYGFNELHEIDVFDAKGDPLIDNDERAALQLADDVFMCDAILRHSYGNGHKADAYVQECYRDGTEVAFTKRFPKLAKRWSRFIKDLRVKTDILDTATAGEGSEWVPIGYGRTLHDQIRLETPEVGLFRRFNQPTKTFQIPLMTGLNTTYIKGEAAAATLSALTTAQRTWTAYAFAVYSKWSDEIEEDAILSMLPIIRGAQVRTMAEGLSMAIMNGDDDGANHFDDDYDSDLSGQSAQTYNSSFAGLRWMAQDATNGQTTSGSSAALSSAMVLAAMKLLGKFAARRREDVALATNVNSFFDLLGDANVETVDKYGPRATIVTGELASVYGIPLLISHAVNQRSNSVATTGENDATGNTLSMAIVFNHRNWLLGDRRDVRFETDKVISTGVNEMLMSARWSFNYIEANTSTTEGPACTIIDID